MTIGIGRQLTVSVLGIAAFVVFQFFATYQLRAQNDTLEAIVLSVYYDDSAAVDSILNAIQDDSVRHEVVSTGFLVAAATGNLPIGEKLLDEGADVSIEHYQSLQMACMFGHYELIGLILRNEPADSIPYDSVNTYHYVVIEAPPELFILFLALLGDFEDMELPDWLQGDSTNIEDLWNARGSHRYVRCIDTLYAYGAKINTLNEEGVTALDEAMSLENINAKMIGKLINLGFVSSQQTKSSDGLVLAARYNNWNFIAGQIAGNDSLINEADSKGNYALHAALKNGWEDLADSLVSRGAYMALIDSNGWNASHAAAAGNCQQFLKKYGDTLFPLSLVEDQRGLKAFETGFVHDATEASKVIFNGLLDSVQVRSRVFLEIDHLAREDWGTFGMTDEQLFQLRVLLSRNMLDVQDDSSYVDILAQYVIWNDCPSRKQIKAYVKLLMYVDTNRLTDVVFTQWFDCLSDPERKALIQRSPDPNSLLRFLVTIPGTAKWKEDLKRRKVDWETRNSQDATPLILAAANQNWEWIIPLLNEGAGINTWQNNRRSLLYLAMSANEEEMTHYLLAHGALLTPIELNRMRSSGGNTRWSSRILAIGLLRQQILQVNEKDTFNLFQPITRKRKSLVDFEKNQKAMPRKLTVKTDQKPRFFSIFPMTRKGNYELHIKNYGDYRQGIRTMDFDPWDDTWNTDFHEVTVNIPDLLYIPFIDMGDYGKVPHTELTTKMAVSFEIPKCKFDPSAPSCYPFVTIENMEFGDAVILTTEYEGLGLSGNIIPGGSEEFDRSKGTIKVSYSLSSKDRIATDTWIKMNRGIALEAPRDSSYGSRIALYNQVFTAYFNQLDQNINSKDRISWMVYGHLQSEWALQKNFPTAIIQDLETANTELKAVNDKIKELYAYLYQSSILHYDKASIIQKLEGLVDEFENPTLERDLDSLVSQLEATDSYLQVQQLIGEFLNHKVFLEIHLNVLNVQVLFCELSQFLTKVQLEQFVDGSNYSEIARDDLWYDKNIYLAPNDLDGKGKVIIDYLKK